MKKMLKFNIQACINSYEGAHGKVRNIFDTWDKRIKDNIEYYFGVQRDILYVVFRGTDRSKESQKGIKSKFKKFFLSWRDWIQNFDTHSIDIGGGKMHLGFFEDNQKIQHDCVMKMKKYDNIVITGHSKGACQALLLYYFARKVYKNKQMLCFAFAPAKCSKGLKKGFSEKEVYVIINQEDFVCKIPQWKFEHVGKIIRFKTKNIFFKVLFKIPFVRAGGAWMYHRPQKYLELIKSMED